MNAEKKPTIWQLWTDKSKRTEWQNGYVSAFPVAFVSGVQIGVAIMLFVHWWASR